jgi:hypothetical protein
MVSLLLSEALGFNGINVIVFQCLGGFFCSKESVGAQRYNVRKQNILNLNILLNMDNETKYSESEYVAEYGCCGYVLYQCNRIVLQHPYPYPADE